MVMPMLCLVGARMIVGAIGTMDMPVSRRTDAIRRGRSRTARRKWCNGVAESRDGFVDVRTDGGVDCVGHAHRTGGDGYGDIANSRNAAHRRIDLAGTAGAIHAANSKAAFHRFVLQAELMPSTDATIGTMIMAVIVAVIVRAVWPMDMPGGMKVAVVRVAVITGVTMTLGMIVAVSVTMIAGVALNLGMVMLALRAVHMPGGMIVAVRVTMIVRVVVRAIRPVNVPIGLMALMNRGSQSGHVPHSWRQWRNRISQGFHHFEDTRADHLAQIVCDPHGSRCDRDRNVRNAIDSADGRVDFCGATGAIHPADAELALGSGLGCIGHFHGLLLGLAG